MNSEDSEKGEFVVLILSNWQIIAFALFALAHIAAALVSLLEALGAPKWAAIIAVALLPLIAWLVVSLSYRGQNVTSLALGRGDNRSSTASEKTGRGISTSRFHQPREFGGRQRFVTGRRAARR